MSVSSFDPSTLCVECSFCNYGPHVEEAYDEPIICCTAGCSVQAHPSCFTRGGGSEEGLCNECIENPPPIDSTLLMKNLIKLINLSNRQSYEIDCLKDELSTCKTELFSLKRKDSFSRL